MPTDFTGTIGVETDRAKLARNAGINTNFLAQRKKMAAVYSGLRKSSLSRLLSCSESLTCS